MKFDKQIKLSEYAGNLNLVLSYRAFFSRFEDSAAATKGEQWAKDSFSNPFIYIDEIEQPFPNYFIVNGGMGMGGNMLVYLEERGLVND